MKQPNSNIYFFLHMPNQIRYFFIIEIKRNPIPVFFFSLVKYHPPYNTKTLIKWRQDSSGYQQQKNSYLTQLLVQIVLILRRKYSYNHIPMTMYFTCTKTDSNCKHPSFDLNSQTSTEGDQNEWTADVLPLSFRPLPAGSGHKAKTSLCKNYTEKGFCSYGKKCQFAHGPEELRVNMEHNRSYKTKTCHAFAKKGVCHYGQRCNFIHEQIHCPPTAQQWQNIYSNHRETIRPQQNQKTSRLLSLLKQ